MISSFFAAGLTAAVSEEGRNAMTEALEEETEEEDEEEEEEEDEEDE